MSWLVLVIILVALGVAAHFVNAAEKISPGFKKGIVIVILIVAVVLTLSAFGVWDQLKSVRVPKL